MEGKGRWKEVNDHGRGSRASWKGKGHMTHQSPGTGSRRESEGSRKGVTGSRMQGMNDHGGEAGVGSQTWKSQTARGRCPWGWAHRT